MCPPQHGSLLWPGHLCRWVCLCVTCMCVMHATGLTFCVSVPGPDTKLMQNSGRTKFKRTSIDRLMNTLVLWVGHPTSHFHDITISGHDLSGFNLASYIPSNHVFYPNLGSTDQRSNCEIPDCTFRHLTLTVFLHLCVSVRSLASWCVWV